MIEFRLRDVMDLFNAQTNILNSLWQNYSAVTGVLIGIGVSGVRDPPLSVAARVAASLAFAMFSFGNWVLLKRACAVQTSTKAAIKSMLGSTAEIVPAYGQVLRTLTGTANSIGVLSIYHFTIDAAVFVALWVPSMR